MAVIGRKLRLFGRVQGVFFRQWTLDQARQLSVAGWVRNQPDGSLEAHLEGEEDGVSQLSERGEGDDPRGFELEPGGVAEMGGQSPDMAQRLGLGGRCIGFVVAHELLDRGDVLRSWAASSQGEGEKGG